MKTKKSTVRLTTRIDCLNVKKVNLLDTINLSFKVRIRMEWDMKKIANMISLF